MAFLCAGLVLAAAGAHAQGPSDTADTAEALRPLDLAKIWLLEDCGLNTYPFAKVFVDSRAEIVPVLIRAFDDGPPEDLRASTRQSAQLAFERR